MTKILYTGITEICTCMNVSDYGTLFTKYIYIFFTISYSLPHCISIKKSKSNI